MKTMKRFFSGMLALSLAFGGTSIVNAAQTSPVTNLADGGSLGFTADFTAPTISVVVPTADDAKIVLNPFNIGGTGQIYSADYKIINNCDIPVSVSLVSTLTLANTVNLATKAPSATAEGKQALINLAYTDGTGKTTVTAMKSSTDPNSVSISTPMAPKGGVVKFGFTGSTNVSPTKNGALEPWNNTDTITATVAYNFTPNLYATYNVTKTATLYASDADTYTVANGTAEQAVKAMLPTHILGDTKVEVGVVWECNEAYNATTAKEYIFTAKVADINIYNVSVAMPTVKVTVEAASTP